MRGSPRCASSPRGRPCRAPRTVARPPCTKRRPRSVPESRLSRATPTSFAISRRESWPSSGKSASRVRESTGPTPGTLRSNSSRSRQHRTGFDHRAKIRVGDPQLALEIADVRLETREQAWMLVALHQSPVRSRTQASARVSLGRNQVARAGPSSPLCAERVTERPALH